MKFPTKDALKISPKVLSLYFVGPKQSHKIPAKFPTNFPCKKSKVHRQASAGAQGEQIFCACKSSQNASMFKDVCAHARAQTAVIFPLFLLSSEMTAVIPVTSLIFRNDSHFCYQNNPKLETRRLSSIMCKWTRLFWGTSCRRSPQSLSQVASLCSAGIERARKCSQG